MPTLHACCGPALAWFPSGLTNTTMVLCLLSRMTWERG